LLSEALDILLSALLGLLALDSQVVGERLGIPARVRADNLVVPVVGNRLLERLAVRRARVGNAMVREPALKLRLVPLVVYCMMVLVERHMSREMRRSDYVPVFPNQLLAVAWAARVTTRVDARENFMMC
jgi:hypothetical protein